MPVNPASESWRLETPGGIPFRNMSLRGTSTREEDNVGESTATQEIIIDSGNLGIFLAEAFPLPTRFGNGLVYTQQPVLPGTGMVPVSVTFESFTGSLPIDPSISDLLAPAGTYDGELKLTIEYATTLENDQEKDPNDPKTFLEISGDASGSFFSTPNKTNAVWVIEGGDNEQITDVQLPNAIPEPQTEWNVRWNTIPASYFDEILLPNMRTRIGSVNSEPMELLKDAPVDTILFFAYSFRQQYTFRTNFSGIPHIQLEMKFLEKNFIGRDGTEVTHQHNYRPKDNKWLRVLIDGEPLFKQTDLNAIWDISG